MKQIHGHACEVAGDEITDLAAISIYVTHGAGEKKIGHHAHAYCDRTMENNSLSRIMRGRVRFAGAQIDCVTGYQVRNWTRIALW